MLVHFQGFFKGSAPFFRLHSPKPPPTPVLPAHHCSTLLSGYSVRSIGLAAGMASTKVVLPPNDQHQFTTLCVRSLHTHRVIVT